MPISGEELVVEHSNETVSQVVTSKIKLEGGVIRLLLQKITLLQQLDKKQQSRERSYSKASRYQLANRF